MFYLYKAVTKYNSASHDSAHIKCGLVMSKRAHHALFVYYE